MEVVVENLGNLKRKITVTVPNEKIRGAYDKCYRDLKSKVSIKGFRKGKFPRVLMEKRFKEYMEEEAKNDLVPTYYEEAIGKESLVPATQPQFDLDEIIKTKPLVFKASFEVTPEFDLVTYESLSLEKKEVEITDEEFQQAKQEKINSRASYKEEEGRAAEKDDQVILDYDGQIDGGPLDGGKADDQEYVLGSKRLLPEFEEHLVGMKAGDSKEFDVVFPEDYGSEGLQGKKATFNITVKKVSVQEAPELNEEFLTQLGETIKTEEDLDNQVREELETRKKQEIQIAYRESAMEQLTEKLQFEVPESLLEQDVKRKMEQAPGAEEKDLSEEDRRAKIEKDCIDILRMFYLVGRVQSDEKIELDENELRSTLTYQAYMMGVNPDQLFQSEIGQHIIQDVRFKMTQDKVLDLYIERILAA